MAKTKIDDLPKGAEEMSAEEQNATKGGRGRRLPPLTAAVAPVAGSGSTQTATSDATLAQAQSESVRRVRIDGAAALLAQANEDPKTTKDLLD